MKYLGFAAAVCAALSGPGPGYGQEAQVRVDLPKVSLRIPGPASGAKAAAPQMSVAVTLFVPEEGLERLEWRSGGIRASIFDACAASYFRIRGTDADGLDLVLLREHVAEEIRAALGRRDLMVLFRELALR
jgi:hypothetical protein